MGRRYDNNAAPHWGRWPDFNNDGRADLLMATATAVRVFHFLGNGSIANGASVTTGASVLGASVTGASELGVEFDEPESSPEQANNARTDTMDTARTQRRMTDSPIDT